jgi:hypothetical protein
VDGYEPVALTAADVQALRRAEHVTCHHDSGASFLLLSLRGGLSGEPPRVFTASQQRLFSDPDRFDGHARSRRIPCAASVSGYDQQERWWLLDDLANGACFATVTPQRETWRTVVDLLRAGDRLTLVWLAGNNNQYLRDAELFLDEVHLAVTRGERRLVFPVAHTVTPDNTARMIRRLR